ncbi:MAG: exopolysaccharide transport family protein [Thermodesulfobacteriota bacterium]
MEDQLSKREVIFNILYTIFKRKFLIIAIFVITYFAFLFGTFLVSPVWKATALVLMEPNPRQQIVLFDEMAKPSGEIHTVHPAQNLVDILTSRSMSEEIVKEFQLDKRLKEKRKHPKSLRDRIKGVMANVTIGYPMDFIVWLGILSPGEKNFLAEAIDDFQNDALDVAVEEDTSIINISIWGETPQLSMDIANRLAEKLQIKTLNLTKQEATKAYDFINSQAAKAKENLDRAEANLRKFREENLLVSIDEQIKFDIERVADLQSNLSATRITRKETEERIKEVKRQIDNQKEVETASSLIVMNPLANELKTDIKDQELKLAALLAEKTEEHPEVVTLKNQIAAATKRLKQEAELTLQNKKEERNPIYMDLASRLVSLEIDDFALNAKEEGINHVVSGLNRMLADYPMREVELGNLTRDLEVHEGIYGNLKKKIEELRVLKNTVINEKGVQIIDSAFLFDDADQSWPLWILNIIVGMILSSAWALGLAFFLEYWNESFRTADELENKTGSNVFGHIPYATDDERCIVRFLKTAATMERFDDSVNRVARGLLAYSEAEKSKVFLVTGVKPNCGTSTVAQKVAEKAARFNKKVMLIEADFNKPTLAERVGVHDGYGLAELLGGMKAEDVVMEYNQNLHLLISGKKSNTDEYILLNDRMRQFLNDIRTEFDLVIIDAPVASSQDTISLSAAVDRVVVTVEFERDSIDDLKRPLRKFENAGATMAGFVLNKVRDPIPCQVKEQFRI